VCLFKTINKYVNYKLIQSNKQLTFNLTYFRDKTEMKRRKKNVCNNVITYCMSTTGEGGGGRKSEWILTKKSTGNRKFMGRTMDRQHWYSALVVVYSSLTTRNSLQNPCQ